MTNAVRHADAREVTVTVTADEQLLRVVVADDGAGISAGAVENAGIRGMRERALAIGSTLTIESAPGHGVRVTLALSVRTDTG
jgi:two-component system sensor histidine kinase UhpB